MPKNKSYDDRKKILNEAFRSPRGYTLEELIERVIENLGMSVSKKTIQNDIRAMKLEAVDRGGELVCKNSRYTYEPKNLNLFEVKIEPASVAKIKLAASILKQIPGLDLHIDLKEIYSSLEMRAADSFESEKCFIQFDTRYEYEGAKHFAEILEAVLGKTVISFDYQPFNHSNPMRITLHPYLLKEYNNRWFLIGLPEHLNSKKDCVIHQYGLERIVSNRIKPEHIEYFKHPDFDPDSYYANVIGVTIPNNSVIDKIRLRFSASRAWYIETNPIHPSQKLEYQNSTHKTFSYELIINQELESLVLSFGKDIEVLDPSEFREKWLKTVKQIIDENPW